MAVYRQHYTAYEDRRTPPASRFWVLTRFAFLDVFRRKFVLVYFVLCFVPCLGAGAAIYLNHNVALLLSLFPGETIGAFLNVNANFFTVIMGIQSALAFFLAALVGPGLVSPDLTNGALPLYFSRPMSRTEYTLGKFAVLAVLISMITWIPGMLMFVMEASLSGSEWLLANLRLAAGIFIGSWAWIVSISLLAIALSAWVRWRPVAGALLFAFFFATSGFGAVVNEILRTNVGTMMMFEEVIDAIWEWLMTGAVRPSTYPLPVWTAWSSLFLMWAGSIGLLWKKLQAYEVVR